MRKLLLTLATMASLHAAAAPGLNLAPMPGDKEIDVVKTDSSKNCDEQCATGALGRKLPVQPSR